MRFLSWQFGITFLFISLTGCANVFQNSVISKTPTKELPTAIVTPPRQALPSTTSPAETMLPTQLPTTSSLATDVPLDQAAIASCPVTLPNVGTSSPSSHYVSPFGYGNGDLWVALGPGGKYVPAPEYWSEDGSLDWKIGWYRRVRGKLIATGRRLDAPSPPARGDDNSQWYGDTGFQAGGVHFPSEGCWEITGKVGDASLTYVTLVAKVSFDLLWPKWLPEGLSLKDRDLGGLPRSVAQIWGVPILGDGQVSWDIGQVSLETTQGSQEKRNPYPEDAIQVVSVHGQPGICVQGNWDATGQWNAKVDAGALEWSEDGFSYRIGYKGLRLNCEDLLRVAGSSS